MIGESDQKIIIASRRTRNKRLLAVSAQADQITIGDELISIDGILVKDYLKLLAFKTGGVPHSGSLRAALFSLSTIDGKIHKLPLTTSNVYEFRSSYGLFGETYTVSLPWIAATNTECWTESKNVIESLKSVNLLDSKVNNIQNADTIIVKDNGRVMQNDISRTLGIDDYNFKYGFIETADPAISWRIHSPKSKNIAILSIDSFPKTEQKVKRSIKILQNLLSNEFKDTNSLLIDVRLNTGGSVTMADLLPQLFTCEQVKTGTYRATTNNINQKLFNQQLDGDGDEWTDAYKSVKPIHFYTPLVKLTETKDANMIGQYYSKPVGVFISGRCYAACEVFAASMKDNHIATIFGEDLRSGGGASVSASYNNDLSPKLPDMYFPIPYLNQTIHGAQDLKVAWKQYFRIDNSAIEDNGISSDHVIRATPDDFTPGFTSSSQYDRIADILTIKGIKSGQNNLDVQILPIDMIEAVLTSSLVFTIKIRGINTISILDDQMKILDSQVISTPMVYSEVMLRIKTDQMRPKITRFNIRGFNSKGKIIFSSFRSVKFIPSRIDYLQVRGSMDIGLLSQTRHIGMYEFSSTSGLGWIKDSDGWKIGGDLKYMNNIESRISFFINRWKISRIEIQITYQTEINYDYLEIGVIKNGRSEKLVDDNGAVCEKLTGNGIIDQVFLLPSGNLEFFIQLSSDESIRKAGAILHSIKVIE